VTQQQNFPAEFVWAVATASYQVEGAASEDGRGESIWDRFSATPGKVRNGDTGAVACDFYHRSDGDIALMQELGVDAFRFSIAWPRILPEGRGKANGAGLDFYDRLVDKLLGAGVDPYVTLYHWDLPQALEDAGGWPSRSIVEAWEQYVEAVVGRLGDRVKSWITHNEPWVAAWLGYGRGIHAPGRTSTADALAAAHHLLLTHGRAVEIVRREAPDAAVGITLNLGAVDAASDSEADVDAARHVDGELNRWFLQPVFEGSYPEDMLEDYASTPPPVQDGDLATISVPVDFLGVNNYSRHVVAAGADGHPRFVYQTESAHTDMGWEVAPDALRRLLVRLGDDYAPPAIYITENGAAFSDHRSHDGEVRDPDRCDFLTQYTTAVRQALESGVPIRGYFVWSLLDNFEWAQGYAKRFGIVFVDYPTLERTPKSSFHWYRDFIAAQRAQAAAA
jgi:beta-glucosidase